jgi:hypothetical protein
VLRTLHEPNSQDLLSRRFPLDPEELRSPELNKRKRPVRSGDLVKGLSSPALLSPVRARLAARASPRLLGIASARLLAASAPARCSLGTWLPGIYLALAWHLLRGTTSSLPFGLAYVHQLPALVLLGVPPTVLAWHLAEATS